MSDQPTSSSALTDLTPGAPHNREAEEAVLGAVLVNPEAYYDVASFLATDDFFLHRNRWVWEAFNRLHDQRQPMDILTVSEELERQGHLEEAGGPAYLAGLISNVPSSLHAEAYGRLIEEAATRRRLLAAANQIAKLAYQNETLVEEVVNESEKAIFGVSERRHTHQLQPIRNVLSDYYDRIDYLARHRDETIGVPTGFIDLDRLLGGMQPSDLLIIAGRPGQGKSGFCLSAAKNASQLHKKHVAVFSLEMSNDQVVQRLIAQETGIDSQRLRLGDIHDEEWPLFTQAVSALGDTYIYLDDTPAITPLQLRTKCRRLHMEVHLDLVIVDYVQLMTGDSRIDNRVQEVSYITRNLKVLARELNLPVLAAAQLSRAVEQRSDKRPVLSDLRESGCLAGDSLVTLADSGEAVPIRELNGKAGVPIWALNSETMRLESIPISRAFSTGTKPVFKMRTGLGRSIRATANHRFLTPQSWKRLDELSPCDCIALPRSLASAPVQTMTPAELALLGHLPGDGCTLPRHVIQYTTHERDLAEMVADLAREVFGCGTSSYKQNLSRERASRAASIVASAQLSALATSDVYWDSIAAIEPDGADEVFDLTVPGHHNFVANNMIVHNSLEQDADVVLFIYRPDQYETDTLKQNLAEIIVAKHRNGPVGSVELVFRRSLAKFENAETRRVQLGEEAPG